VRNICAASEAVEQPLRSPFLRLLGKPRFLALVRSLHQVNPPLSGYWQVSADGETQQPDNNPTKEENVR
jgi:hypothetical protein